jgi:hypothetical protein
MGIETFSFCLFAADPETDKKRQSDNDSVGAKLEIAQLQQNWVHNPYRPSGS